MKLFSFNILSTCDLRIFRLNLRMLLIQSISIFHGSWVFADLGFGFAVDSARLFRTAISGYRYRFDSLPDKCGLPITARHAARFLHCAIVRVGLSSSFSDSFNKEDASFMIILWSTNFFPVPPFSLSIKHSECEVQIQMSTVGRRWKVAWPISLSYLFARGFPQSEIQPDIPFVHAGRPGDVDVFAIHPDKVCFRFRFHNPYSSNSTAKDDNRDERHWQVHYNVELLCVGSHPPRPMPMIHVRSGKH